jgi:hypothetical protein
VKFRTLFLAGAAHKPEELMWADLRIFKLLATDALPELAHGDYPTAASIADNLQRGGSASVRPIISALTRVAEDANRERHSDNPPKPALVLLVWAASFALGQLTNTASCVMRSVRPLPRAFGSSSRLDGCGNCKVPISAGLRHPTMLRRLATIARSLRSCARSTGSTNDSHQIPAV